MLSRFSEKINISSDLSKMLASFMSANFVLVLGQAIAGILVAKMVSPNEMGLFVTATIVLTYIPIILLGVGNGLNRNLPFVIGQGKLDEAHKMRNTAISWALLSSCVIFLIVAAISFYYYYFEESLKLAMAFFSVSIIAALHPIISIVEVTYRTNHDFIKLSKIKLFYAVVIIATLILVYVLGFLGLLIRAAVIPLFYVLLLFWLSTHKYKFLFDTTAFKGLLKTGIPIYIVAYLYTAYLGLDKVLIANFFGTETMGLYVPAIQVGGALAIIPASVLQIIYPRLALKFGQTGQISSLKNLAFTPLIYLSIGLIPVLCLAAFLIGPFVELVLPSYVEGIPAARWMILVYYFKSLGGPQDVLTVIGDLKPFGILTIVCSGIFFGGFIFLNKKGWQLEAVPMSLAFSVLIFNILISFYVLLLMKKEQQAFGN